MERFLVISICFLFITTSWIDIQPTRAVVLPNWMLARDGVHTGEGQYALENRIPLLANFSRLGV